MNKTLRKLTSSIKFIFVLLLSLISINFSVIPSKADCNEYNNNGQYIDVECAKSFAFEKLKNEKTPYLKMDNVGENSEYTLYFFSPSKISEILNQLEAPIDFDTFKMQKKLTEINQKKNSNKIIEKISKVKNWLSSALRTSGFAGTCYVTINNFDAIKNAFVNNFNARRGNDIRGLDGNVIRAEGLLREENFNQMQMRNNANLILPKFLFLVPLTLLDIAVNFVGNIVSSVVTSNSDYSIAKQNSDKTNSYLIEKNNYFSALKKILSQIKLNNLDMNKFLCLEMNKDTDNYMADVYLFNNEDAQYTESEKIKFNNDIENLKDGIEKILANNK